MADYYWKGGSGSNGWNTAANWVNSGGSAYGSPPSATDDVYFDNTGGTDCVLDNTNLVASYIYIQSNFGHSITMSGLSAKVVMDGMEVSKAAVFNLTAATEFEIRSSGAGWSSYTNATSTTSNNHYIRYLIDSSPFANATSRLAASYDFNGKNYCLVDGVYPTIDRPGNLEAKAIFKDTSGGTFNSYGSVDLHDFTNNEFTSTSTNPDVYDYDKQFYFEGRYGSDSSLSYRIGENFKFGHTTVIFRAGTDSQGGHFQVPVKGDIISSGIPRGNTTTNVFNVQYHKVIIRAPPEATQLRYCYIEDGRTLECNELVIESGGRLYGPAEGEQVASAKIKSVKRPTIQGDWNFKQIADGIYESIDNIPTLPVTEGGTGLNTVAVNSLLIGQGQLPLSTLAMGTAGQVLKVNSGGTALEFGAGGISLNGSTTNGILTFGNSTTADVEANITASGATFSINNPAGNANIELGGSTGGFLDLKGPFSDDYDLRIRTTGTGGSISTDSNADLAINVGSGAVNVTGDLNVGSGDFIVDDSAGRVGIGETSPDAPLHIKDSGTGDTVIIESTDVPGTSNDFAPHLVLYRSGSPTSTTNSDAGQIIFRAKQSAASGGADKEHASIKTEFNTDTHSARLRFNTLSSSGSGNDYEYLRFDGGVRDIVFNEEGRDIDFRVEGDNDRFMFVVDANVDRASIGMNFGKLLHAKFEMGDEDSQGNADMLFRSFIYNQDTTVSFEDSSVGDGSPVDDPLDVAAGESIDNRYRSLAKNAKIRCNPTSGDITVSLPTGVKGERITIFNVSGSHTAQLSFYSGDSLGEAATGSFPRALSQYQVETYLCHEDGKWILENFI